MAVPERIALVTGASGGAASSISSKAVSEYRRSAGGPGTLLSELRAIWVAWDREMLPLPQDARVPMSNLSEMLR